jgi:uncharacterized protein (TIGR01777 family)
MHYLVTGGTGFVGRALCRELLRRGQVTVLTRSRRRAEQVLRPEVGAVESLEELSSLPPQAVINLAGESLMSGHWSPKRKALLRRSRVETTQELVRWIGTLKEKPSVLVSASAIGYYGARGDEELREDSPAGHEFQSELCAAWEAAAHGAEQHGIRVCCLRFGIVLGRDGGALARMLPAFRMGLGGPMGDGTQWMSWIHRDDLVGAIQWALARPAASGAYNATSPNPVINGEFARTLAAVMHRPARLKTPALALQLLFGEMSRLLLTGQKVIPARLQEAGFMFRQPDLRGGIEHLLS